MGFIFYMSSNNGQVSHEESTKVVNFIQDKTITKNSTVNKNTVNRWNIIKSFLQ